MNIPLSSLWSLTEPPHADSSILLKWVSLFAIIAMGEAEGKAKMDLSDFAVEMERDERIRDYLRGDGAPFLFDDNICQNVKDACKPQVHAILEDLMRRTVQTEGMPQPSVHALRHQLTLLYEKCGRTPIEGAIISDSWHIRKFTAMVKMKTRKQKVSTATQLDRLIMFCLTNCNL